MPWGASEVLLAGKILIVDADEKVQASVAAVVRAAHIEPLVAGSIDEAKRLASAELPDLALVGDELTDGPGATLIGALYSFSHEIEIILMTSPGHAESAVECVREGACDVLIKPFNVKQLAAALQRVMKNRARRRTALEPAGTGTVLVVEDEPLTLRIFGNMLAEVGFAVFQARNLTEARHALDTRLPDVVVCDVFLESESGLDFLRESKHRWPFLPVVVATSSTQASVLMEAMRAEAYTVLIKPVAKEELQRIVLSARRMKCALEERSVLRRRVDGLQSGLAYLQGAIVEPVAPGAGAEPVRAGEAFESLPSGLVMFDRDRRAVDLNPAALRLLKLAKELVIGRALEELPALARFEEALLQTLATGQTFTNLEATCAVGGAERTFGYNVAPLVSPEHAGGALLYFQDITAKKKVEAHLRQTERLASVGMLAAGVTNEISTPLTVALGYTDMIVRGASDPARVTRNVEKIQEALKQAGEFAARLISMVKSPDAGARPTDVHQALRDVVRLLERKFRLRGQEVQLELVAQGCEVMGDPVELEQVFLNLVNAASDRTAHGGTLHLATANLTGVLEIGIGHAGPSVTTPVDPGTQPDLAQVPVLGLEIAKNIVHRYGGVMRFDAGDLGNMVVVRFPVVAEKHRARWMVQQSGAVRASTAPGGRTAVVLADPGETAESARQWLTEAGHAAELRSSVQTALEPLASGGPAVFVVDGAMIGADWIAFLRLAAERRIAPVIVLLRDEAQRVVLSGLGAAAPARVVARPLTGDALLQAVALAELESSANEAAGA